MNVMAVRSEQDKNNELLLKKFTYYELMYVGETRYIVRAAATVTLHLL